jgi:hypothetical protein
MRSMSTTETTDRPPTDPLAYESWLDALVRLEEGAKLQQTSVPTLRRNNRDKLVYVGERAVRIRRRDALKLPPRQQANRGR